jgi:RNA polymerase sigma factor (sigma-70 family)
LEAAMTSEYPHLTLKERDHWYNYKMFGSLKSRNFLILNNTGMVYAACRKVNLQPDHPEMEDIIQEGQLYLIAAIDMFDMDRGWRFSTYGMNYLLGKIRNLVNRGFNKRRALTVELEELEETQVDPTVSIERQVIARAAMIDLDNQAKSSMRVLEYQCFQLHFVEQHSLTEVQREIGLDSYLDTKRLATSVRRQLTSLASRTDLI